MKKLFKNIARNIQYLIFEHMTYRQATVLQLRGDIMDLQELMNEGEIKYGSEIYWGYQNSIESALRELY